MDARKTAVINSAGVRTLDGKVQQWQGFLNRCLTGGIKGITKMYLTPPTRQTMGNHNLLMNLAAPRANFRRKLFLASKISVENKKEMEKFSIQYGVEEEHVTAYHQHMKEE